MIAIAEAFMDEGGSVLIVDDNPNNLQVLGSILEQAGYKVRPALSGEIALRAIDSVMPDLILLDIRMPGMNGYETCQRLKANERTSDIPVIFISALHEIEDKLMAFQVGGVDYVSKPFQSQEVLARVMTHLKIRRLQQQLKFQNEHLLELVDIKVLQLADADRQSRKRLAEIAHMNRNITSSVYSAAIAHDLRQPLAAILSNAEAAELFLQQQPPALQAVQEILADIRRDNQRASQIIQRMRSMLNKGESEILLHDLNDIVNDVVTFLSGELKLRDINMTVDVTPVKLPVMADRIQLQQVMVNLIINSMDAISGMPREKRHISVHSNCLDDYAEMTVIDTGTGFGENLEYVFESFFTTKKQGMGMGMSITASLIHLHNGQIMAQNSPDGGAIVHFKLPLQADQTVAVS